MIAEAAVAWITLLVENCTGVVLTEFYDDGDRQLHEGLLTNSQASEPLRDFTEFDENDCIFQEFDPPEIHGEDPKSWKESFPSFKVSLKECLQTVLLIQTVVGSLTGLLAVGIELADFIFGEWCYDMSDKWNQMPKRVQILRVTTSAMEGAFIQMSNFTCISLSFPCSLIKDLHLLTLSVLAAFVDISYRLYMQMLGLYGASWRSFPLNVLFIGFVVLSNFLLARHFHPRSLKNTLKLDFILSAQFIFAIPVSLFLWYVMFPWYLSQDEDIKIIIATFSPLICLLPKAISRLGAQTLYGIVHPGNAHVLVASVYAFAIVFRIMQSELNDFSSFVVLGIAHAAIDLIERLTITMRDHIWEYLYRLVRRQRTPMPKYRSPRSRRFIADVSIQIMLQEAAGLVSVLGLMTIYKALYTREKPFIDQQMMMEFFKRAAAGLLVDLFFNTISVLIQTRVMNIAVCRVWKKKWRYHCVINFFVSVIGMVYCSKYVLPIVEDKYIDEYHPKNCSFPSFL